MNWIASNWIWLALGVGVLALFAFGRGGYGMSHSGHDHGRRGQEGQSDRLDETTAGPRSTPATRVGSDNIAVPPTGHAHGAFAANQAALATEHAGHDSAAGQAEPRRHRHGC